MSLRADNVSMSYGRIQVLWDVSVRVEKGEIVALIGANGAGKSSLLKSIIGITKPQSGNIFFDGMPLLPKRIHQRVHSGIGYVPEGRRLFYSMTVEENLRMGASKSGSKSLPDQMNRVFDLFPVLKERRKQFAGNLSGGEQQMVAIGRALMSQPKLMMLDELSFGLAPVTFQRVLASIKEINQSGVSILLAEQNAEEALDFSNRAYVIENGRIALEGESKDLIDSPKVKEAYLGVVRTRT